MPPSCFSFVSCWRKTQNLYLQIYLCGVDSYKDQVRPGIDFIHMITGSSMLRVAPIDHYCWYDFLLGAYNPGLVGCVQADWSTEPFCSEWIVTSLEHWYINFHMFFYTCFTCMIKFLIFNENYFIESFENSVLRKLVSEIGDTFCEDISLFCVVQSLINIETWLFKEN